MDRRRFLVTSLAGALAASASARAQPARKVYRIGILSVGAATPDLVGPQRGHAALSALLRGLRELGYM